MQNCSDKQLVANYLKDDEKSLEILIKRYLKPIYGFVYRRIGNPYDAEDVTQDVFVKVWRNIKRFKRQKNFKTWIFSIAKNTCIDFYRKKKTIPFSDFENEKGENMLTKTLVDTASLPDKLFKQTGITRLLQSAIEKLLPKYRLVLSLYYNDNFNFREIAKILKEPLNTIKSRHRRALIMLKRILN